MALALLARYPLPTSAGTANNYRRADDETRRPGSVQRSASTIASDGPRSGVRPPDPVPRGLRAGDAAARRQRRHHRARSAPNDTTAWSFASSYQRTFSTSAAQRAADRRHAAIRRPDRRRARRRRLGETSGLPGIPTDARFPNTLPTFLIAGYQQLGSPPNTATDFSTSVTQIADTPDVGRTAATRSSRRRPAVGAAQRHPAAVADRVVHLQQPVHRSAGRGQHRHAARQLPARPGPAVLDRSPAGRDPQSRAHSRSTSSRTTGGSRRRITVNAGLRYTLNFPSIEENDQAAVFNLETQQLEYLGTATASRAPRASCTSCNFGPRLGRGRTRHATRRSCAPATAWCGSSMAGITTPFTTPVFPFLQTVSQRTLDNITRPSRWPSGPDRRADSADADAGPGAGRVRRGPRPGLGLRPAVERVAPARARRRTSSVEVAYVGSKITRVGIPDTNLNQLTVDSSRIGAPLLRRVAEPLLRHHPALIVARRSDDSRRAAAEAVSAVHDRQPVSQQRRDDASTTASTPSSNNASRAACRTS